MIRAYRTDDEYEAKAATHLFRGLDEMAARHWLSTNLPGQCLFRDRHGRIGRGLRDLVWSGFAEAIDTSPEGKARRAERGAAAEGGRATATTTVQEGHRA
ncbi:MAG: hypothetical protein ACREQM_15765 [Candidatus Dormibacteraceae bacterium]